MNEKHYIKATEFLHDSWKLAAMVRKSGWKPDFLVGLWRGGAPVAVAIHEFLKATDWSVQHVPLKCAIRLAFQRFDDVCPALLLGGQPIRFMT